MPEPLKFTILDKSQLRASVPVVYQLLEPLKTFAATIGHRNSTRDALSKHNIKVVNQSTRTIFDSNTGWSTKSQAEMREKQGNFDDAINLITGKNKKLNNYLQAFTQHNGFLHLAKYQLMANIGIPITGDKLTAAREDALFKDITSKFTIKKV
jgi:hypothetical protein